MADSADTQARVEAWIARVAAFDDHDAFAELVHTFQSPVRRFLRRLTGGEGARADDLAQETFLKAYRHVHRYEGRGRFLSWLFRIAYQEFVSDERRRHGVHELLDDTLLADDRAYQHVLDRITLDQAMAALRPTERAALALHYHDELSHPEVAEVLGLPLGTAKSLIRRARLKLRDVLVREPVKERS